MKTKLIFFLITIMFVFINSEQVMCQKSINDADNLFYNLDLNGSLEAYLQIFQNNKANDGDRALAGRKLGFISWHFHNDLIKAREYYNKSLKFKKYEAYIFSDLIQHESEAKIFTEAKEVYQYALLKIESDEKLHLVNVAYTNMVLKEAFEKIKNNQPLDTVLLNEALKKIEEVNMKEPGILQSAKIQLGLAMLMKEGQKAMNAWQLYFNISDGQKAKGLLSEPQKELSNVFLDWNKTTLSKEDREKLIFNLAASRFYEFAFVMKKYLPNNFSVENPIITDIVNYYNFCTQIENRVFKYYKDLALMDENNISKLKKDVVVIQKEFWDKLSWKDKKPKYSKKRFYDELYKRFGTKLYVGNFDGNYFFIGGHTIIDRTRTVEQFNHKAEIQFVVLDLRFSNNYWGWFTGYYGFAAYASDVIIARYREPASSNPIYYWKKLNNKELLSKWKEEIIMLTAQDDSLALINPNASLKGIYERIRLKIYSEIVDSLKAVGLQKDDLRKQFISIFNEIEYNHYINHEGRHAIDFNTLSKIKLMNNTELEFRATLSQIYFSKYPLLDISFEINNTPHGLAHKKILLIIAEWMEKNKDEINGFDKNKPTLPQLDLLTDKQLRMIIESVEPFLN